MSSGRASSRVRFGEADADDVDLVLASLIDGLAVQATLGDPVVSQERMLARALDIAEHCLVLR
jgi:hypothetical protein